MSELSLKRITTIVGLAGLLFAIFKFINVQEIEAAKPFLLKKLEWCEEAVKVASSHAVRPEQEKELQFLEIYWGVLGMVERDSIIRAMNEYRDGLSSQTGLKKKALNIAHACREELAEDWSPKWSR